MRSLFFAALMTLCGAASQAQTLDPKFCAELADPANLSVDADGKLAIPPGLSDEQSSLVAELTISRLVLMQSIRKNQMALEVEAQLNLIELALSDKFKGGLPPSLNRIRDQAQDEAEEAQKNISHFTNASRFLLSRLCPDTPPSTIVVRPLPPNMLFPGLSTGVVAAPLPPRPAPQPPQPAQSQPPQTPQPGVVTYTLVETKLNFDPNNNSFTTTNGRITNKGPNYQIVVEWTPPPASLTINGSFPLPLSITVSPPPKQKLASGIDVRGGFLFDSSPPNLELTADGKEEKSGKTVTVKPFPTNMGGDVWLQVGMFYGPNVAYRYQVTQ